MIKYLFYLLVAAALSFFFTPLVRSIAHKLKILDIPNERKIHRDPVPLLGGIPIFFSFNLTIFLGFLLNFRLFEGFYSQKWISIFISQLIILGVGIYDDVKYVRPSVKFLFQILAGCLLVLFGFSISLITNPFTGNTVNLGIFSIFITIIWVVGITNAINLLDGLDGLATGTSIIACITIFGISYIYQNLSVALVALVLAGSALGFLKHNFPPAKIFLGDSGSLLLGFLLAVLSIEAPHKGATLVAILAPILALGLPIVDTLLSLVRRFLKSINFVDNHNENGEFKTLNIERLSLFKADKDHIHHRLLKFGFSPRKAVFFLYGICLFLCILALINVSWKNINVTLFLLAILFASYIGIRSLDYKELDVFKSGILLPLFDIPIINKRLFQAFLDLLFVLISYYLSFILIFKGFVPPAKLLFIKLFPIVLPLKIMIFYLTGLYKGSWRYSNVEEFLKLCRSLFFSSIVSSLILILMYGIEAFNGIAFFIIDFYFLLTLVAGSRISFKVVDYYYHKKNPKKGINTIIYGAGRKGYFLANELLFNTNLNYRLVGFIDDDLRKQTKTQLNVPILGTFRELESILRENKISEIIVSTENIGKKKIDSLSESCKEKGIGFHLFRLKIDKIV